MSLNAVSAAIHTDTHFGATNNVLPKATYHPDVGDTKNWVEQQFLNFCISVKTCIYMCIASGSVWDNRLPVIRVLTWQDSGNWTLSCNALNTNSFDVFFVASMEISRDARMVAVGASAH